MVTKARRTGGGRDKTRHTSRHCSRITPQVDSPPTGGFEQSRAHEICIHFSSSTHVRSCIVLVPPILGVQLRVPPWFGETTHCRKERATYAMYACTSTYIRRFNVDCRLYIVSDFDSKYTTAPEHWCFDLIVDEGGNAELTRDQKNHRHIPQEAPPLLCDPGWGV